MYVTFRHGENGCNHVTITDTATNEILMTPVESELTDYDNDSDVPLIQSIRTCVRNAVTRGVLQSSCSYSDIVNYVEGVEI